MMFLAEGSVWLPEQASTLASELDSLFYFVYWTSVVLFVGVVVAMLYLAIKYRRKSPDERASLVEESKVVEVSWVVIPAILVLIVFTWGFQTFIKMGVAPSNAYEITVRGKQWLWEFEYPNGITKTNELHVPADRPVRLKMSSQDVLHSFFVPAFRVKQDVLPNRYSYVWFEPTKVDTFKIACTEYCGTQHSGMYANVIVQPQEEFRKWLDSGGGEAENLPLPEYGAQLYTQQGCQACHSIDGSRMVGPSFTNLHGKQRQFTDGTSAEADENYLRTSIVAPGDKIVEGYNAVMPASYSSLDERQLSALVAFIKEQSDQASPSAEGSDATAD